MQVYKELSGIKLEKYRLISEIDVIDMYVRIVNLMLSIRFSILHIFVCVNLIFVYSVDSLYDHFLSISVLFEFF